jgi:hypothetical protein
MNEKSVVQFMEWNLHYHLKNEYKFRINKDCSCEIIFLISAIKRCEYKFLHVVRANNQIGENKEQVFILKNRTPKICK